MTVRELGPAETALGYRAMVELRPRLATVERFVSMVNEIQRPQGYRLVASFAENTGAATDAADAVAVAGFRTGHFLSGGHSLYVDDLCTRPDARRRGHASALLAWLDQEAARLGCERVCLDSNTGRHDAHRVYLASGFRITSFHFVRPVGPVRA
ncbi:MAG TPA: GNAT family N-acetyltransferase [Mycobacteriales bacterium]|nr:GNAT family N-acetyltransferase [Mycobacteriales bacterium]